MLSSTIEAVISAPATHSLHRNLLLGFVTLLIVAFPSISFSQPNLNFLHVTINWPTIELYFRVGCNGQQDNSIRKENIRILENGQEITEFTLWCPDPTIRCAGSFAFVADVSGSMHGAALTEAQQDLKTFVQSMDGVVDEGALITAGRESRIAQMMISGKIILLDAIAGLRASGVSSLYDGIMEGVLHLIDKGVNQCRAVIVFTDGWDNYSAATVAEIISLANRHRIRVFTIGVGLFIHPDELETIALLTGGRYLQNPDADQMYALYHELTTGVFGISDCIITYERDCSDGAERIVEFQLRNFCGGSDARTKTYRAPLDSSQTSVQRLRIGRTLSIPRDVVTIPILLDAVSNENLLRPFDITIRGGVPSRPLLDVVIPNGSPLTGAPLIIDRFADSVRLRLTDAISAKAGVTLLEMQFSTADVHDSAWFPLGAIIQSIDVLCAVTMVDSGGYRIVPRILPRVEPEGIVVICPHGSVELQANEGFVAYRWSTGDTTRSTIAANDGSYFVDVIDGSGDTLRSDVVELRRRPERKVWIAPSGPLTFCRGLSVTLRVAGDTAGTKTYWHKSSASSDDFIARNSGSYWASVVDSNGCRHYTDTVDVLVEELPVTLNISGKYISICPDDSIELRVQEDYAQYFWSRGAAYPIDSSRSIIASTTGGKNGRGEYAVRVRTVEGCESEWSSVFVLPAPMITPTLVPRHIVLCPGGEAQVSVAEDFASYRWSTGDTNRIITVRDTGTITVEGFNSAGCVTQSAPLAIEIVNKPQPRITPVRFAALCPDDSVLLDVGDGYVSYRWSTGDTTRMISVGNPGPFFVDVMAYGGCWGRSDTLVVRQEMTEYPEITYDGEPVLCPDATIELNAPEGYARYLWNTLDSTRTITVHEAGIYVVMVLSAGGCEGISNAVYVQVRTSEIPIIVKRGLVLSTTDLVAAHQWFLDGQPISGATGPLYEVTQTGRYTVQVIDSCGAVLTSEELLVTTLGIAAGPTQFRLDVYPDPGDGIIHIAMTGIRGEVQAELMDLLGRSITHQRWSSGSDGAIHETMDFRHAPRGVYLLRITHHDGIIIRKVARM